MPPSLSSSWGVALKKVAFVEPGTRNGVNKLGTYY